MNSIAHETEGLPHPDRCVECEVCMGMGECAVADGRVTCPRCNGLGRVAPGLLRRMADCRSIPMQVPGDVPVVAINVSDFISALERGTHGITALVHLEGFLCVLEGLRKPVPCTYCEGSGQCERCAGSGKKYPRAYTNLIGDNRMAALKNLAADLRAALDYAKGVPS